MKLNAAVKVGVIGGVVVSICLQGSVFLLFYVTAFELKIPARLSTLMDFAGVMVILATGLLLGPLAVITAGDGIRNWRDAALTGGGAGLIVGAISFMMVGTLALVIVLGVVPFIAPLTFEPSTFIREPLGAVLRPIVRDAVWGVYSTLTGYLLGWTALGAVEGAIFALARPLLRKKTRAVEPAGVA